MTTPGLDRYEPKRYFSNSSLCSFARCPRMYFYGTGCGLSGGGGEEHIALTFGSAIHHGIGYAQDGSLELAMKGFSEIWGDKDTEDDSKRNSGIAANIFTAFIRDHANNRGVYRTLPPPDIRLHRELMDKDEVSFAVDLGLSRPFVGKIDAVGEDRDTKNHCIIEYKTVSFLTSNFSQGFYFSPQVFSYAIAYEILTGTEVKMAFVEALHVAKTVCNNQTIPITIFPHNKEVVLTWMQEMSSQIATCESTGEWRQNPCGCNPYSTFGIQGFTCPYQDLCLVEDWTELSSMYTTRRHDMFEGVEI